MPSASESLKGIGTPSKGPSASAALGKSPQEQAEQDIRGDEVGGALYHAALPVVGTEIDYWTARALHGKDYADALVAAEEKQQAKFAKEHPYVQGALTFGGSMLTPGLGKAEAAIRGLESGAAKVAAHLGLGGSIGAAQGAQEAGRGHRGQGAISGGLAGTAATGGLMAAGKVAGAAGRGVDALTGHRISSALESGAAKARRALGMMPKPHATGAELAAGRRMSEAAKAEKFAERAPARQAARAAAGMEPGAAQEVAAHKGPIARLTKVAGRKMGAAIEGGKVTEEPETVLTYAERKAENLPSAAVELVGRIHDYPGTSDMRIAQRVAAQRSEAATKYREPWAQPVVVEGPVLEAVTNPEARSAIAMARRTAALHGDAEQVEGLQKLERYADAQAEYTNRLANWEKTGGIDTSGLPADAQQLLGQAETPQARERLMKAFGVKPTPRPEPPTPPEVPAGALDRIHKAIRDKADSLMDEPGGAKKATHGLGAGLMKLSHAVDEGLGNVPGLSEARGAFKAHQDILDALHQPAKLVDIMNAKPENFKKLLSDLPEGGLDDVKIAVRDLLSGRAQGDTGPAIGLLRKISRGDYAKQNLRALVGDEMADQITASADILRKDLEQARFIAGVQESNTAANLEDAKSTMDMLTRKIGSVASVGHWLMDHIVKAGMVMTPEEASAILKFSHGSPEDLLSFLAAHPESGLKKVFDQAKTMGLEGAAGAAGAFSGSSVRPSDDETPITPPQPLEPGEPLAVTVTGVVPRDDSEAAAIEAFRQQMEMGQ